MVLPENALPGRDTPLTVDRPHLALGCALDYEPEGSVTAYFALGCFWGAERKFFQTNGVRNTVVGYQGGFTPNPTYQETCTGLTGHAEVVKVIFDPTVVSYRALVGLFFESHDPTQGYRQGGDIGTQYRSAIYVVDAAQESVAREVLAAYQERLYAQGFGDITTEIAPAGPFYWAEEYHQQYLIANPNGYCGLGGTGVSCPIGLPLS